MAIYHMEVKVISRGTGRSAVAAAAYASRSCLYNDYDGIQHDYTLKQDLAAEMILLPPNAPVAWNDREHLWGDVENEEHTKDSCLAREFILALPAELGLDEWIAMLRDFGQENMVGDGMCVDVSIHNDFLTHNPHAHMLTTVRPLDEHGHWQYKTQKEYLCIRDGIEQGFTAAEYAEAKELGWEKQYLFQVGDRKEYMTLSEGLATGYKKVDKHPKSTKYGRQNPITARWNSDEQLMAWREKWAIVVNKYLEHAGLDERVDHRSFAERGIDTIPTIHEGVIARALERKGITAERCEINRQIRADNSALASKAHTFDVAAALEETMVQMVSVRYKQLFIDKQNTRIEKNNRALEGPLARHKELTEQITTLRAAIKDKTAELDDCSVWAIRARQKLRGELQELREEYEEKISDRAMVRAQLQCQNKKEVNALEKTVAHNSAVLQKNQQIRPALVKQWDELCDRCESMMDGIPEPLSVPMQPVIDKLRQSYGEAFGEAFDEDTAATAAQNMYDRIMQITDRQHNTTRERADEHQQRHKWDNAR